MNTLQFPAEDHVTRSRQLCRAADVHPAFPMATSTVAEVLRSGGGYDVSDEWLNGEVIRGNIGPLNRRGSGFAWLPEHVSQAARLAETWRRWLPMDRRHLHKMTAIELAEAQAISGGQATAFTDIDKFDCRAMVRMVDETDDRDLRHAFAVGLLAKLRKLGVIDQ